MSETTPLKRQPSRRGAKRTRSSAAADDAEAAAAVDAGTAAAADSATAPAAPAERKRAEQIQSQVQALLTELEPATPAKPGAVAGVPRPNLLTPQRTPSRAAAAAAAGAGSGALDVTATPTRATREEEQKQLRDLNKRLELYIVKMREKDASSGSTPRELELFKEKKEQELVSLRKLYEEQLHAVRSDRDRISADLVQANGEKTMRESLFGQQAGELAALKKYKSELESQMKKLTGEQQGAAARVFALEEQSKKLALELENSKVKAGASDKDSSAQRARADAQSSQLAAALAKAKALEEDLALERKRAASEVARYEQTIVELTRKTTRSEDQVRKEFHKQMSAALAERQQQYEDEKNEGLSTLKAAYDEKMNAFREELERVGHELEAEKSAGKSLQSEILRLTTLSTELMAIRDSLANRIAELEELLKAERLKPNKLIAEKNDVIRRIKAAFKRKDAEFDELMDVKIALAMEIKAYRSMLEREEERLGLQSPLKKRKRAHATDTPAPPTPAPAPTATPAPTPAASRSNGAAPAAAAASAAKPAAAAASAVHTSASVTTTTTTTTTTKAAAAAASASDSSSLLISGADLDGQYITIRNGSTETVPLLGWALKSKVKGSKFQFPDIRLLPGQSFVVRTAEGARAADAKVPGVGGREHAGASAWCSADVWDSAGDEALLVDPEGEVIARVEVIPTGSLTGLTPVKTPAPAPPNPAAAAAAIAAATKQVQAQAQAQTQAQAKPAAAAAASAGPAAVPTLIPQPRPALNAAPTPKPAAAAAAAAPSPAPAKAAAAAAAAPLLASPKPAAAAAAAGAQQPQQQNCTIM